jgi:hypothetical protein
MGMREGKLNPIGTDKAALADYHIETFWRHLLSIDRYSHSLIIFVVQPSAHK